MVDSLIFRVHDLVKHEGLVKYLERCDRGVKTVQKEVGESFNPVREIYIKDYYRDLASGKSFDKGYNGFIRSSHYDIVFFVHYRKDYIEVNASLPKYWFGTNVLQLVDHFYDRRHLEFRQQSWFDCSDPAFDRFAQIFNLLLDKALGGLCDKSCVEICRIDLCYNLVFNTQHDAMYYLQELKKIERPRFAATATKITNYHAGLYFPSEAFTFKIYHKGAEFKKHSYFQYKKRNGEERAKAVQTLADRMLRFEIELRKPALTSIYFSSLKVRRADIYKCIRFSKQNSKSGYIVEDDRRLNFDGLTNDGKDNIHRMSPDQLRELRTGDFLMNRRISFFLRSSESYSLLNLSVKDVEANYIHREEFNFRQFDLCVDFFKKYFLHFQLGNNGSTAIANYLMQMKNEADFKRSLAVDYGVRDYRGLGINFKRAQFIFELLLDNSWDEVRRKMYLSERTFRRYKRFFNQYLNLRQHNSGVDYKLKYDYSNYLDSVLPEFSTLAPFVSFPI